MCDWCCMINFGITDTHAHTVHSFLIFELLSNHERKFVTKFAGTPQIRFTLDKNVRQAGNTWHLYTNAIIHT